MPDPTDDDLVDQLVDALDRADASAEGENHKPGAGFAEVIAPGAFADQIGRRIPVRLGDGTGPIIGVAEVTSADGALAVTITARPQDVPEGAGSIVYSTAQVAGALVAQQPRLEVDVDPAPTPAPTSPGGMPLGHHGGCR